MLQATISFISENYLVPESEILVSQKETLNNGFLVKKVAIIWEEKEVCTWSESIHDESHWIVYSFASGSFAGFERSFEEIKIMCITSILPIFIPRQRDLLKKVDEQSQRIRELEDENTRLRYAPGGEGALEAEKHFRTLQ
ncbi:hypothetical protein [Brazilian marseillevirus]|uniref:hypothetical protein n=1 Tax=Brazilian marseillevirus TaxID=1813599 RepID=UPI000784C723|nr:hypothetical protein A3303_gp466 [Brazilian marseillevirus]AMQ10974.1 hypothetical protein [Brazilian marseillevirus]